MKVTRAVGFLKPRAPLILFVLVFSQMDWMSVKWLFFKIYLSSFFVIFTHNIYCNRWQWHVHLHFCLKDFTLFIDLIYLFILLIFYIVIFSFLIIVFLLLSFFLFIYYYYESVDLFIKKEIPLIDKF